MVNESFECMWDVSSICVCVCVWMSTYMHAHVCVIYPGVHHCECECRCVYVRDFYRLVFMLKMLL